ncbi:HIT family protein [Tessaracoccus sp. OH4464_COT-324]|uniref:HIT family protein n=1 Tax=Tessaracoccus sp. OH4464_COT-324 TaxID=2491059 RepID=UPI000F635100|nr:HIT family protein [Tessaracoccus sp. OH4464_COT-324]RRD47516.1 HIT family protein [Tessaracoccus sp. OH4464_COT-324]
MECLFCRIIAGSVPSYRVYEDPAAFAFLDIAPWQVGHALVVPKRHSVDVLDDDRVLGEIAPAIARVGRLLKERLGATAVNVVSNAGADAGQEVFHTHVHVVPRYASSPGLGLLRGRVAEGVELTWKRIVD